MDDARPGDIAARVAKWKRTGDLFALWPDVAPAALAHAHARIRSTAEQILRASLKASTRRIESSSGAALESETAGECKALGIAGYVSGMGPMLGWWMERGLLETNQRVGDVFALHLDHGRRRVAMLHARLEETLTALRDEGVDAIVLKGLHTGVTYFPEAGTRTGADIDLLVHPRERDAAERALRAAGFRESRRTVYSARSEWTLGDTDGSVRSLELDHAENPWTVDLHDRLRRWYFRGLRYDLGEGAFDTAERVSFGSVSARVLTQPYLIAFLALHASHDVVKTRLVRLMELALVIDTDLRAGRLNWAELLSLVRSSGGQRLLHPALALTDRLVPGVLDGDLLAELNRAATARARRVVEAVDAGALGPLPHKLLDAKLMWASGLRETLLSASELVIPSDDGMGVGALQVLRERFDALRRGRARWRSGSRPKSS